MRPTEPSTSAIVTSAIVALAIAALTIGCGRGDAGPTALPTVAAPMRDAAAISRALIEELPVAPPDGYTHEIALEDPTGHALDALGLALERAARGEGVARIVAYGGSHTASDLYTGAIRTRLQGAFGDAGHGFVLPVPPISRFWQHGVRIADAEGWTVLEPSSKRMGVDRYGLAGMAFEAREAAWAEVETDGSSASRIDLLYMRQPGGGALSVRIDRVDHVIDTAGASEVAAIASFAVPDGRHRIELRTEGTAPVRVFGLALEREVSGVIVDQLGVAGAKARHQLLWEEETWLALLRTRRPDLLLLSYGNNELDDHHLEVGAYEAHFTQMIERLGRHFPDASCLVVGPSDRRYPGPDGTWKTPSMLPILIEMMRRVALAEGCAFFDTLAWQGGEGAVERWLGADPPLEREDRIHFTEPAYRRLGVALLREMLRSSAEPPRFTGVSP